MATRFRTSPRFSARTSSPHLKAHSLVRVKRTLRPSHSRARLSSVTLVDTLGQRKCLSVCLASTTRSKGKRLNLTIQRLSSTGSRSKAGLRVNKSQRRPTRPLALQTMKLARTVRRLPLKSVSVVISCALSARKSKSTKSRPRSAICEPTPESLARCQTSPET